MKNIWKWIFGIALPLLALPFLMGLLFNGGYGMMPYNYGWHMPMMYPGFGMLGYGMMLWMWLIFLVILALLGLGIAILIKAINNKK